MIKYTLIYKYKDKTFNLFLEGEQSHDEQYFKIHSAVLLPKFDVTEELKRVNEFQLYQTVTNHRFMEWGVGSTHINKMCHLVNLRLDKHFREIKEREEKIEANRKEILRIERSKTFFGRIINKLS